MSYLHALPVPAVSSAPVPVVSPAGIGLCVDLKATRNSDHFLLQRAVTTAAFYKFRSLNIKSFIFPWFSSVPQLPLFDVHT